MSEKRRIEIYDTTLRDGTQGEGFNLSLQDKLLIAQRLDELGVDYIEGGFPLSNPKDAAFFQDVKGLKLRHAKVSAFGMTRRRGVKAEDDPGMKALLEAETPVITLVGKTSDYQAKAVLNVTPEENLAMISDSVKLMRSAGRQVVYDAEHFFDTFRSNPDYALRTLLAATEAGASVLALCDTNGGTMPEQIAEAVEAVRKRTDCRIGIHTHNDAGLAIANALAAIRGGASHAQGTINGVGERCGNMDLIPLIANLQLKYGFDCLLPGTLSHLTEASRYVYETANLNLVSGQPYVGSSAFAHKGGMHVHAVQKDVSTYEHVKPETIGNTRKILISEMSGASNIAAKAGKKFDIESDKVVLRKVLEKVQELENAGYQFEVAEASFELLLRKEIGRYRKFFDLQHYRVTVLKTGSGELVSEATIKVHVDGASEHTAAEGDGPVNALDGALRRALKPHYSAIDRVHLIDYKVRVINSKDETAASVRVVIECRRDRADGTREVFGTIGVSPNIIDASWQALVDAYEYHLIHEQENEMESDHKTTASAVGVQDGMAQVEVKKLWQRLAIATNWPVLVAVAVLSAMGIISILAASRADGIKQCIFFAVALGCMALFQAVNYLKIGRFAWGFYFFSLCLVLYTVLGNVAQAHGHPLPGVHTTKGVCAWINFGPISLEPAELMKLAFVMVLARYLRYRQNYRTMRGLIAPFVLALIPLVLILKQPDLGMAMLFLPVLFAMLFVAGAKIRHLAMIVGAGVLLTPIAWFCGAKHIPVLRHFPEIIKPYQRERMRAFLDADNPAERQRKAYQTYRAMVAFASGSLAGKGFGNIPIGQSVPEAHNDMIFALIGEQFGFFGAAVMLASYLVLFAAGIEIASNTREPFGRLVAVGIVATLACQSFINLMVCTGLFPVTGITLPFVSYGGSSMVASFMAAGLLLNVGQNRPLVMARESFEFGG